MPIFNEKKIMVLIFFVALLLRLFAIINLPATFKILGGDSGNYDNIAVNLLAGRGYSMDLGTGKPTSFWVPLYPVFLASIYAIFGIKNHFMVRFIQSIMSALLSVIIFYIGKIAFNKKIGLLAGAMLVFYQPYIFYSCFGGPAFIMSENLFTFLLALTILFMIKNLFVSLSLKNTIITGSLMGIIILTRAVFVPFPLFLLPLLMYKNKYPFLLALKKILPLFIVIALIILPWTVRNAIVHKAFVPLSTEGGFALFSANNPLAFGGGLTYPEGTLSQVEREQLEKMSEAQRDKMLAGYARGFLFKNYKKIPELLLRRLIVLWDVFGTDYSGINISRKYNIWFAIVLMFGLVGIVKSLKSKFNINSLLFLSLFFYSSIIALIFAGDPRQHYAYEPYLIIFASVGIFTIYNAFRKKFLAYALIGIIVGINLTLYLNSDLFLSWARYLWR